MRKHGERSKSKEYEMRNFALMSKENRLRILKLFTVSLFLTGAFLFVFKSPPSSLLAQSLLPPAVYYGGITPTVDFAPMVGMSVRALINGAACGQTTVQQKDGKLAYTIHVTAENPILSPNGCGTITRTVTFQVGSWTMDHSRLWHNRQAWFHPLTQVRAQASNTDPGYMLYLPVINR